MIHAWTINKIFYIYQEPKIAWEFTQKREEVEERHIPKESFITGFLKARENVILIKQKFGNKVQVHIVLKDYLNEKFEILPDVAEIDKVLPAQYTEEVLRNIVI